LVAVTLVTSVLLAPARGSAEKLVKPARLKLEFGKGERTISVKELETMTVIELKYRSLFYAESDACLIQDVRFDVIPKDCKGSTPVTKCDQLVSAINKGTTLERACEIKKYDGKGLTRVIDSYHQGKHMGSIDDYKSLWNWFKTTIPQHIGRKHAGRKYPDHLYLVFGAGDNSKQQIPDDAIEAAKRGDVVVIVNFDPLLKASGYKYDNDKRLHLVQIRESFPLIARKQFEEPYGEAVQTQNTVITYIQEVEDRAHGKVTLQNSLGAEYYDFFVEACLRSKARYTEMYYKNPRTTETLLGACER
jgi:hypothetical protein